MKKTLATCGLGTTTNFLPKDLNRGRVNKVGKSVQIGRHRQSYNPCWNAVRILPRMRHVGGNSCTTMLRLWIYKPCLTPHLLLMGGLMLSWILCNWCATTMTYVQRGELCCYRTTWIQSRLEHGPHNSLRWKRVQQSFCIHIVRHHICSAVHVGHRSGSLRWCLWL